MCMYEWALLAQVSLIRLVYLPSDNSSYFYSGQQVGTSLVNTYIYTYIHTYIQVHAYIHVHLQRSISIPCVPFRVAISSEGTADADSSAMYVLAFLFFMHLRMYVCIFVYAQVIVYVFFACLLNVCKFVSLPNINPLTYIALNLRDRASATLPPLDWDLMSVFICREKIEQVSGDRSWRTPCKWRSILRCTHRILYSLFEFRSIVLIKLLFQKKTSFFQSFFKFGEFVDLTCFQESQNLLHLLFLLFCEEIIKC